MRNLESPYLRKVDVAESFAEAWTSSAPNKVKYSKVFIATTPMKDFPGYFEIVKDGRCWCNGFLTGAKPWKTSACCWLQPTVNTFT